MIIEKDDGAARGFVCAKHNEFAASGICRWCEPVETIAPAAPPCTHPQNFFLIRDGKDYVCGVCSAPMGTVEPAPSCTAFLITGGRCGKAAVWDWPGGFGGPVKLCQACHDERAPGFPGRYMVRIGSDPGNASGASHV